jgi:DNA-binding XRE family transcriptional regulator
MRLFSKKAGKAKSVKKIRLTLGRTQEELARALGISTKAIQSYEQGWRSVPVRLMMQLLILLALYRRQSMQDVPCWKIKRCKADLRKKCMGYTVGRGQFCWFVGVKECMPKDANPKTDVIPCMQCAVIKRLLRGPQKQ